MEPDFQPRPFELRSTNGALVLNPFSCFFLTTYNRDFYKIFRMDKILYRGSQPKRESLDYFVGSSPHRGDIVPDSIPLATLRNVGKAVLNADTCRQTPAAKRAIDALYSDAFMHANIIDEEKLKNLRRPKARVCKYPKHIEQMLDEKKRKRKQKCGAEKTPRRR